MKPNKAKTLWCLGWTFFFCGCTGLEEKNITGTLTFFARSGYETLDFKDPNGARTGFSLRPGRYRLQFDSGLRLFRDPTITIFADHGEQIGRVQLPSDIFTDHNTFEFYGSHPRNPLGVNILGGRRQKITSREWFSKLREHCTYEVQYVCTKTREVSVYDSKGKRIGSQNESYITTCTKVVDGVQDQLWSKITFRYGYRILIDGYDMTNIAVFTGDTPIQTKTIHEASDSCGPG